MDASLGQFPLSATLAGHTQGTYAVAVLGYGGGHPERYGWSDGTGVLGLAGGGDGVNGTSDFGNGVTGSSSSRPGIYGTSQYDSAV